MRSTTFLALAGFALGAALMASCANAETVTTGSETTFRDRKSIEIAASAQAVERKSSGDAWVRVTSAEGRLTLMAVEADGSITLRAGATISFGQMVEPTAAGALRGFIPVLVGDEVVLLPVYRMAQ